MNRGSIGTYAWAECVPVDLTLPDVLRRLKRHFLGLRAANGDQPGSRRRHHREWPLNDCGFEEWYFFSRLPSNLSLAAYCNWLHNSVGEWAQLIHVPNGLDLCRQLEEAQPDVVLGEGQRLFAISRNEAIIQDFAAICDASSQAADGGGGRA